MYYFQLYSDRYSAIQTFHRSQVIRVRNLTGKNALGREENLWICLHRDVTMTSSLTQTLLLKPWPWLREVSHFILHRMFTKMLRLTRHIERYNSIPTNKLSRQKCKPLLTFLHLKITFVYIQYLVIFIKLKKKNADNNNTFLTRTY